MFRAGNFRRNCLAPALLICTSVALQVAERAATAQDEQAPAVSDIGAGVGQASGASNTDTGGYIDSAIVRNKVRFRFDAAFNNPFPDRAEYFYPKCGCFAGGGPGPPLAEFSVDYQDLDVYLEVATSCRMSVFVDLGVRSIDPVVNANHTGLRDARAGFKYALLADPERWLTFQLRGYFPTGDGDAGLGTEHVSIEPGLLYQNQVDKLTMLGELKAWIPIGSEQETFNGTLREFSGTVLQYGLGAGYDLYREYDLYNCGTCRDWHRSNASRLTAVAEFVGWTILDGLKLRSTVPTATGGGMMGGGANSMFESAVNDTIVNLKLGLRLTTSAESSFYIGYGRALTGDVWYEEIARAEYAVQF